MFSSDRIKKLMGEIEIFLLVFFSALFIVICLLTVYFLICVKLSIFLSYPNKYDREYTHNLDVEKGLIPADMSFLKRETLNITARDGTLIKGDFSYHENQKGIVILAHGYTWTREGALKYGQFLYNDGFSIYIYDERFHGESDFKYVTMGHNESMDVCDIVNYFKNKYGKDVIIGLQGESMGAASVMNSLKYNPDVDFVLEDCGYESLKDLIKHKLKQMKLPSILLIGCNLVLKIKFKYTFKDVEPINSVKNSNVPLLIMHGKDDTLVPVTHALDLYEATKKHSEIHIFNDSEHAKSYENYKNEYEKIAIDFIHRILKEE